MRKTMDLDVDISEPRFEIRPVARVCERALSGRCLHQLHGGHEGSSNIESLVSRKFTQCSGNIPPSSHITDTDISLIASAAALQTTHVWRCVGDGEQASRPKEHMQFFQRT